MNSVWGNSFGSLVFRKETMLNMAEKGFYRALRIEKPRLLTTSIYKRPTLIQNVPHMLWTTVTRTSRALKPYNPAMNWAKPPKNAMNGKNMVGEVELPHQFATQLPVIQVELAKPASPRAAGAAMGCRKIVTFGSWPRTRSTLSSCAESRAMLSN